MNHLKKRGSITWKKIFEYLSAIKRLLDESSLVGSDSARPLPASLPITLKTDADAPKKRRSIERIIICGFLEK